MDASIKCPICLDILVEATVLRCGHSFCQLCLDEAVNVDDRCPECRRYTHGILISNLRLNECIYSIVKENENQLDEFKERIARHKAVMALRRSARASLFSILHRNGRPLSAQKIEQEFMATKQLEGIPDELRVEIRRIIHSNPNFFEIVVLDNEERVMLKNLPNIQGTEE